MLEASPQQKPREFVDKDSPVMETYYNLMETSTRRSPTTVKRQLEQLIAKDPDFSDPYLLLFAIASGPGTLKSGAKTRHSSGPTKPFNLLGL